MSASKPAAPLVLVVAVDYSVESQKAVAAVKRLTSRAIEAVVHVVHVFQPPRGAQSALDMLGAESAQPTAGMLHADNELDLFCRRLQEELAAPVVAHLRVGSKPAEEIVAVAAELGADLVVVGTHGRSGIGRVLLGSVAESVARSAPCPVIIARDEGAPRAEEVTIEPPCPDCLAVRAQTNGQQWWCERHSQRHPRPRTYRSNIQGFAYGSQLLRPE